MHQESLGFDLLREWQPGGKRTPRCPRRAKSGGCAAAIQPKAESNVLTFFNRWFSACDPEAWKNQRDRFGLIPPI